MQRIYRFQISKRNYTDINEKIPLIRVEIVKHKIYFNEYKNDPNNAEGWYTHSIIIYPQGGESGPIQISTNHTYEDDGASRTDNYDIGFWYDNETDTLTVSYINIYGE